MAARAAASPALCLAREPASSRPAQPPRRVPPKAKRAPRALACSRGRKGRTESATAVSLRAQHLCCVRSTISTAPPRPGAGSTVRPAPQMPLLPPACGEAFVATLARRANLAVSERAHTADPSRCRHVASPPLLPRPSPRRRQVAQSPAGRLSPRPPPSPAQWLVSAALDRPPFLPKLGIAPGCLSDPAHTTVTQ